MLKPMNGADIGELKLNVRDVDQRSVVAALETDPPDAQVRHVVSFDTPDLTLDQHGVVVRVPRVQGQGDDLVVKLRPVVPSDLPADLRKSLSCGL
jgi:hypothetical protein